MLQSPVPCAVVTAYMAAFNASILQLVPHAAMLAPDQQACRIQAASAAAALYQRGSCLPGDVYTFDCCSSICY